MARDRVKDVDKIKGPDKAKEEIKEEKSKKETKKEETRALVRVANTDLDGDKSLFRALMGITGISFAMSKAICNVSGLDSKAKLSSLGGDEIDKIEQIISDPVKFGIPTFLVNRRRDLETGNAVHLSGQDFNVAMKFDVKREIDSKSYRGWRHMLGQPVRGQETRSHFRQKGRVVGVMRKEIKLQMQKSATAPATGKTEEKKAVK